MIFIFSWWDNFVEIFQRGEMLLLKVNAAFDDSPIPDHCARVTRFLK
jgi:hypothetical protein